MAKAAPADLDNLRVMNPIPEYGSRLQSWVSAFGANNVHIHNYDLLRGSGQGVVKHFFGTHFDASVKSIFSENSKNTSFSASAIYALDSLHQDIPLMREGKPNAKFLFNAQRFYSQLTGPAFLAGKQFEEHCNNGRDRDRDVLEKLLSRESLDRMYQDPPAWSDCPQMRLPEDVVDTLASVAKVAVGSQAREKFFAALNALTTRPDDDVALGNLHVALFNLNDPVGLRSCASWLVRHEYFSLAHLYLQKAQKVGATAASLSKLKAKVRIHIPTT